MLVIVARGDLTALTRLQVNPGELWIVGSALCWALYTVLLRRSKFELELLPLVVLLLGAGAIAALPFYLWELVARRTLGAAPQRPSGAGLCRGSGRRADVFSLQPQRRDAGRRTGEHAALSADRFRRHAGLSAAWRKPAWLRPRRRGLHRGRAGARQFRQAAQTYGVRCGVFGYSLSPSSAGTATPASSAAAPAQHPPAPSLSISDLRVAGTHPVFWRVAHDLSAVAVRKDGAAFFRKVWPARPDGSRRRSGRNGTGSRATSGRP